MAVELTFWDIFGPRIVFSAIVLILGGVVWVIAGGAARAYERTAVRQAAHFQGLSAKTRKSKRTTYVTEIGTMRHKGQQARKLALAVLAGITLVLAFFAVGTALEVATTLAPEPRTAVSLFIAVAAAAILVALGLRSRRRRAAALDAEADTDA